MHRAVLRTRLYLQRQLERLTAPLPVWRVEVDGAEWEATARAVAADGGRLVSLWGTDNPAGSGGLAVSAAYALAEGLLWVQLPLGRDSAAYPDLARLFPAAARMQRAAYDLLGITAAGAVDRRPWLRHDSWPAEFFPLRKGGAAPEPASGLAASGFAASGFAASQPGASQPQPSRPDSVPPGTMDQGYAFVKVEGDGVHEIPVGPVHAGIIEPGHFRFSVVGEKVLRLEERLGYTHKGIEKRFESMAPQDAFRLAGRVSGDATVAFAWAYCMALESASASRVPPRAEWVRALFLERERIANHLGDLGALGNDAAFAFGLAQFSRLREQVLRLNQELFGHRLLMDRIVPGGVAADVDARAVDRLLAQCEDLRREVRVLRNIYDEHAGLQDRFLNTGCVSRELAARLGLCGLAGRASGLGRDLRVDYGPPPYRDLHATAACVPAGDVAARVAVRFDELTESLRLVAALATGLPAGHRQSPVAPPPHGRGAGWVESWRGDVFVALELDAAGAIGRCHCHDPSWQNWPVLEHAIIGNIVPDFPLINKSFNLSYSGQDL